MIDRSPAADTPITASAENSATGEATNTADRSHGGLPPLPVAAALGAATPIAMPAASAPSDIAADEESPSGEVWQFLPSWLVSVVVHLAAVLVLALVTTWTVVRDNRPATLLVTTDGLGPSDTEEALETEPLADISELEEADPLKPAPLAELPAADLTAGPIVPLLPGGELQPTGSAIDSDRLLAGVGENGLAMRLDGSLRRALLASGGGTAQSEEAVMRALHWLAEHQEYDGSWTFQHQKHPKCHGQCGNPGYTPGKIAATSLALLPFLGTGQTQYEGTYKHNVDLGLKFLVRSIKQQGQIGSLWEPNGTMYGHGLASIALCEAYGMTHDQSLREPAQAVINYIVEAQDKIGGGWRYHPQTPGDTSVVGWQLMALKSAQMAYLRVPPVTLRKTEYFLDSVQGDRGAVYGYQRPDARRPPTTAIGLLCRMYLGWDHDSKPLERGVHILGTIGPSTAKTAMRNNMYYNYYATQVMHHWGGYPWERWNAVMREYLIETQSTAGHEKGSWYFDGADHGSGAGGRLYCTAMGAMILEVYYRHMPLYREQSLNVK